jgi:cytochrome bd-type quinol oxidase subunit 1
MNKKTVMITAGAIGGAIALGAGAWAIWNSRQLRMARAARRIGQILYKAGTVLQSVSEIAQ